MCCAQLAPALRTIREILDIIRCRPIQRAAALHVSAANCGCLGSKSPNRPSASTWCESGDRSQGWKTLLRNHAAGIASLDLLWPHDLLQAALLPGNLRHAPQQRRRVTALRTFVPAGAHYFVNVSWWRPSTPKTHARLSARRCASWSKRGAITRARSCNRRARHLRAVALRTIRGARCVQPCVCRNRCELPASRRGQSTDTGSDGSKRLLRGTEIHCHCNPI
jgi:hypothetical protein